MFAFNGVNVYTSILRYNVVYEVEAASEQDALELASIGEVEDTLDEELETVVERYIVGTEVAS